MSQLNSMTVPMEGRYSRSELLELKNKMNVKALAKEEAKQHSDLLQMLYLQS